MSYSQEVIDQMIDSLNITNLPSEKIDLCIRIANNLNNTDFERAITYLELAEKEAKGLKQPNHELASIYYAFANIYYDKDVFDVTLEYYQKAYNLYAEEHNEEALAKAENNLAIIYARLNNEEKALEHFKSVYDFQTKQNNPLRLSQILNNIGTLFLEKNIDSSLNYYNKAYAISQNLGDSAVNAHIYTNLGRAYSIKKDSVQAYTFFKLAQKNIPKNNTKAKSFVYQILSEYFLDKKQNDSAIFYAQKTLDLEQDIPYSFTKQHAISTLYKAHLNQGNYKKATTYFESFNTIRDSLNIEEKAVNVERLKLEQEYRTREKIQKLETEKRNITYILIGLSLVAGILILFILLIKYRNKITQNKLEQELLESKQQELKQTLEAKNKALIGKAMTEMHRTDIVNGILKDLKQIKLKAVKRETQQAIDFILKRLQLDLNTDIWKEFEVSFESVHKDFYVNLSDKHPDLTPKDRRLCALLYLDLTSKEISQITGQSFKSVENARTRLRKKLDLTNEKINLSTYLNSLS
ncbi:tetratricopeptide repeat protein [Formosa sp. A9]|uniref:tetratricopeptide repeat protein n=1 Tax=Formosa sp. A9 TaxID=3442641 RepID=UPI003EBBC00E